jgi:hypothetical protein
MRHSCRKSHGKLSATWSSTARVLGYIPARTNDGACTIRFLQNRTSA